MVSFFLILQMSLVHGFFATRENLNFWSIWIDQLLTSHHQTMVSIKRLLQDYVMFMSSLTTRYLNEQELPPISQKVKDGGVWEWKGRKILQ